MINRVMVDLTFFNPYGRMFGISLIILGFFILVAGALGGLGLWVYYLATHGQIPLAILVTGSSCIILGWIIKLIFRSRT